MYYLKFKKIWTSQIKHVSNLFSLSANFKMAEALMLEMDGDSDGSITEEELVRNIFFKIKILFYI